MRLSILGISSGNLQCINDVHDESQNIELSFGKKVLKLCFIISATPLYVTHQSNGSEKLRKLLSLRNVAIPQSIPIGTIIIL
jgi:hypothetical protein